MKRRWTAWFLGFLGITASGCDSPATSAPTVGEPAKTHIPEATSSPIPSAADPSTEENPEAQSAQPADPFAPRKVRNMNAIPPPPDLFHNGRRVRAANSGPINTEEADRDFFTDPRFDDGKNSGRLFYNQFFLEHPFDPHIQERRVWFVCWSPLNDGDRAQRLYNRDGYFIEEVTTDGKRLQVHHSAYVGDGKKVDTYRWKGDALGQGRFVLEGATPPNALPAKQTPFEVERDRGYALLAQREYDEAIAAFEKASAMKPGDAATHFARGVAYEESGINRSSAPFAKAIAAYGKAIALDPKRSGAYSRRAQLYLVMKQFDPAIADLTRMLALEPDSWEDYLVRAKAYARKGDYPKAIADTQKASQLRPEEDAPLNAMTQYYYQAGQWEAAIGAGKKALKRDDSETLVRIWMACAYARLGKADLALQMYTDARNNGVATSERQAGIRELKRVLKVGNPPRPARAAMEKLLEQLVGPEQLEPLDEDEEVS